MVLISGTAFSVETVDSHVLCIVCVSFLHYLIDLIGEVPLNHLTVDPLLAGLYVGNHLDLYQIALRLRILHIVRILRLGIIPKNAQRSACTRYPHITGGRMLCRGVWGC